MSGTGGGGPIIIVKGQYSDGSRTQAYLYPKEIFLDLLALVAQPISDNTVDNAFDELETMAEGLT